MTSTESDRQFNNLANALADSLESATDQEILEEVEEDSSEHTRVVLLEGVAKFRRAKLVKGVKDNGENIE